MNRILLEIKITPAHTADHVWLRDMLRDGDSPCEILEAAGPANSTWSKRYAAKR